MDVLTLSSVLVLLCSYEAIAVKFPGPLVYVVTPSPNLRIDGGRSAPQPFYYQNWLRRIDLSSNSTSTTAATTSTTTAAPRKVHTPDLIFAEFESDKMKNIRRLLEKERTDKKKTTTTTTSTSKPIYVPDEETTQEPPRVNYARPSQKEEVKTEKDMTDYFALYNKMHNHNNAPPAPVYLPPSSTSTTPKSITSTTSQVPELAHNMENIWQIIDSQKEDQYTGKWDEVPLEESDSDTNSKNQYEDDAPHKVDTADEDPKIDYNFALPGFRTNPDIGGENESRAIRTEPNIRFPYVNLKPFQMKNLNKPLFDKFSNSKKSNNMFTNLDNFVEVKHPVRGEVQDTPMRQPIDRYNPAQPYLPGDYGDKSKQSRPASTPSKTVANLVPPPPPRPPKITDNDFPAPSTYVQYPPFAPSVPINSPPVSAPALQPPPSNMAPAQPPSMELDDSDSGPGDDGPTEDLGYRYKPPSAPKPSFVPTLPPLQKPGYSYDKPPMTSYNFPPMSVEAPPTDNDFQGYSYDKPEIPERPDFSGYHYKKPEFPAPAPPPPPSYGYHHEQHHDSEYPELIYGHGPKGGDDMKGGDDAKGGDDMKGGDDSMGMVPPPMADMKPAPPDDSGFPHDFPDFKYPHDFDDHDFHHYHHHHTTTTTTTEMPRVNRYSYYYLGKKLYYLPLYFSVYFIIYVGALIIKAVLRHKIVYPNSWRPNDQTASFFSKRSVDSPWDSSENLHDITGRVTRAVAIAAERYMENRKGKQS